MTSNAQTNITIFWCIHSRINFIEHFIQLTLFPSFSKISLQIILCALLAAFLVFGSRRNWSIA